MAETINERATITALATADKIPLHSVSAGTGRASKLQNVINLVSATTATITGNRVFTGTVVLPADCVGIASLTTLGNIAISGNGIQISGGILFIGRLTSFTA